MTLWTFVNNLFNFGILGCKWRRVRLESLWLMVNLRAFFIWLCPPNDLSAVHQVTWKRLGLVIRALMLEKKVRYLKQGRVSANGSEAEPYSSSEFHLVYQLWISLLREEIFGKSPEYFSPDFKTCTNSDGPNTNPGKQSFGVNLTSFQVRRWSKRGILLLKKLLKFFKHSTCLHACMWLFLLSLSPPTSSPLPSFIISAYFLPMFLHFRIRTHWVVPDQTF